MKEGRHPRREELDTVSTTIPILLQDSSGHHAVANSLMLKQLGITAATPDPEGAAYWPSPRACAACRRACAQRVAVVAAHRMRERAGPLLARAQAASTTASPAAGSRTAISLRRPSWTHSPSGRRCRRSACARASMRRAHAQRPQAVCSLACLHACMPAPLIQPLQRPARRRRAASARETQSLQLWLSNGYTTANEMGLGLSGDDIDIVETIITNKMLPIDLVVYVKASVEPAAQTAVKAVQAKYGLKPSGSSTTTRYFNRVSGPTQGAPAHAVAAAHMLHAEECHNVDWLRRACARRSRPTASNSGSMASAGACRTCIADAGICGSLWLLLTQLPLCRRRPLWHNAGSLPTALMSSPFANNPSSVPKGEKCARALRACMRCCRRRDALRLARARHNVCKWRSPTAGTGVCRWTALLSWR